MKLRQAKKIMKKFRIYPGMIWVYGSGRVEIACNRMCRYHSKTNEKFKKIYQLVNENPIAFAQTIRLIYKNK